MWHYHCDKMQYQAESINDRNTKFSDIKICMNSYSNISTPKLNNSKSKKLGSPLSPRYMKNCTIVYQDPSGWPSKIREYTHQFPCHIANPFNKPREIFSSQLITQLMVWRAADEEVILFIEVKKNIYTGLLANVLTKWRATDGGADPLFNWEWGTTQSLHWEGGNSGHVGYSGDNLHKLIPFSPWCRGWQPWFSAAWLWCIYRSWHWLPQDNPSSMKGTPLRSGTHSEMVQ